MRGTYMYLLLVTQGRMIIRDRALIQVRTLNFFFEKQNFDVVFVIYK